MSSRQQDLLRKELFALCSYARCSTQVRDINLVVDNLRDSIMHRVEQLENTLALNRIVDERLLGEIKEKIDRVAIDTYDEEGNQD